MSRNASPTSSVGKGAQPAGQDTALDAVVHHDEVANVNQRATSAWSVSPSRSRASGGVRRSVIAVFRTSARWPDSVAMLADTGGIQHALVVPHLEGVVPRMQLGRGVSSRIPLFHYRAASRDQTSPSPMPSYCQLPLVASDRPPPLLRLSRDGYPVSARFSAARPSGDAGLKTREFRAVGSRMRRFPRANRLRSERRCAGRADSAAHSVNAQSTSLAEDSVPYDEKGSHASTRLSGESRPRRVNAVGCDFETGSPAPFQNLSKRSVGIDQQSRKRGCRRQHASGPPRRDERRWPRLERSAHGRGSPRPMVAGFVVATTWVNGAS